MPRETLWCPIQAKVPFERERRKWQAARDFLTGSTHSFCGMVDRLEGFDIVHIKDQPFCFSYEAALAKRKYGAKLVVTQMENIAFLNDHKFMERHIKSSVREQADLFLAGSEGAKQALLLEGVAEAKIRRISNAIDVEHFKPGKPDAKLLAKWAIPAGSFVILYVGRLAELKGITTLLSAFETLVAKDAKAHLLLVGKDEWGVAGWAKEKGLTANVHLAGFVPYSEMPSFYRSSSVLVLPSLPTKGNQEQFGYVLAEAMACGVSVAGSDCGAIPEVIGDRSRIFTPGSPESLLKVLASIRKGVNAAARSRLRQRAQKLYSSEVLADTIRHAYRDLLK
jgi:glycosyltransferase involved in cell wall biosynthesis